MKHYYRSLTDRKLAGVCGGLGEYANVDPTLLRLAFVFGTIITGIFPLVIAYLVAWAIAPEGPPASTPPDENQAAS